MRNPAACLCVSSAMVILWSAGVSVAQTPPSPPPSVPPRAELEKRFQEELTGVSLAGVWQMTGPAGLKGSDPLSPPKPDQYTITQVTKLEGDYWLIHARIQYADKDVTLPVPVRVVWAEDTPIITVSELALPLLGTYSARVMIHHGFYSGVWYSQTKDYGGVMEGRITKTPPPSPKEESK